MALLQACSLYGNIYGSGGTSNDPLSSSSGRFNFENYDKMVVVDVDDQDEEGSSESKIGSIRLPPLSDPSIANNIMFKRASSSEEEEEELQYVIDFKSGYGNSSHFSTGSLLSFENVEQEHCPKMNQNEEYPVWGDVEQSYQWSQIHHNYGGDQSRSSDDELNSFETASAYRNGDNHVGDERFGWLSCGGSSSIDCFQESRNANQTNSHKRPHMGNEASASKKHCSDGASKKAKQKSISIASKDPQSIAAKNRRERISERLKILQELVPNGTKVDLVTMLEKAISYVKFLQLQVKVLATDEFWPAQGGKAPEVSQVKEALDAILSSNKDTNSSSK
ncbi:hypothetical protein Syun_022159 [Stephania yunnanensis]|uniref:BHLH domain-containing protein n=1 Tax=Stephania yunnanensis TaxID=152371 RepID=A0AAP0IHB6_9MAGN